ncbi:hypothetical protein PUNSTDRAFT_93733 [Punctularia strigosozonata HHB-11173 SS5]|uniref:histidine kinase n=1 Tax=Punctularia strigosozonata (strain HHB-11173) TaxID=741275 RepID=R7S3B7_PUNST|nr:uncharacterized protein PUNSTDRAFT_93733 [Punctularia strigosozonata HHB-11173 SS5]EIN03716.1 hypothetical protein PUNSTDRAFT_93733 [Punctularia strigosozonata HHB-11173 SS5]
MQRQPSSSVSSIASEEGPADGLRERELHAAVAGVGNAGDRTATRSTPALTLSNATPDMGGMLPALESAVAAQQRSLAEDPISALGMDSLSLAAGPSASASVASVSTPGAVGKPLGRSSSVSAVTRTGAIKRGPGKLKLPSFRMNYSLDPLAKAMGSPGQTGSPRDGYHAHTGHPQGYYGHGKEGPPTSADTMTSAAAIRWAAARISVAPLVLPSPEHELTDPMRGVTTSIPGAHPTGPKTPGEQRLSSIPSFWVGTTDVEDGNWVDQRRLETIEDNSPISVGAERSRTAGSAVKAKEGPSETTKSVPPPATAPLPRMPVDEDASPDDDYFGPSPRRGPSTRPEPASDPASPTAVRTELSGPSSAGSAPPLRPLAPARHDSEPAPDATVASVPAVPRRVALTRQTSSPLPSLETVPAVVIPGITPVVGAGGAGGRDGSRRAVREKQMFEALGYLVPPNAPDELERRRALFKFNIWNTSPDPNFDRIVHLAKLVFNTKMVGISLVDGSEEWFKSKAGLPVSSWNRSESLCAHAILRRGEEPMVVLDTTKDWRFANNPMVKEGPEIRFYAGAPLRTQDGYNIGCLSVFDDMPRGEFSPRQRHALREFAAIAMRELELWRDKIQLRVRDRIQTSMEQFTRECLEIDNAADAEDKQTFFIGTSMDKVYAHAAKLVKRTLDVQGAIVLDVAHSDVLETVNAEGSVGVVLHNAESGDGAKTVHLSPEEYGTLQEFFTKYPQGRVSEGIVPLCLRGFLPTHIQYALTVPILNVDKRPFALLCAYIATEQNRRYLEGHELSYLRAIGVIILSAVLKRRMILADRSKGLFISNISHELRTPLHGILAAAELLSDSPLNQSQLSFLSTIQACGTSLVETVNHVLDFTKLSGNTKAGGVENVIPPSRVNLMQLVEEAVEGCWIGYRARIDSEIGSVYAPPKDQAGSSGYEAPETVVDIDDRDAGWTVKCEKGGIRRVLMNLFGNSLKFTSRGYVHVTLRELPPEPRDPPTKVRMELGVMDTGKGISQNFMKNQLFHPFSQENPLQTGTGLGLAIVNSIVQSKTLDGTIDVSSVEGVGTEIRVTFAAELVEDDDDKSTSSVPLSPVEPFNFEGLPGPPRVSLIGFDRSHRGVELLRQVTCKYLSSWGFNIDSDDQGNGDIVIVNDSIQPIVLAIERKDTTRSYIILCSSRGDTSLMGTIDMYERIGGFARLVFKPGGPSRLRSAIKLCIHAQKMIARSRDSPGLVPSASAPAFKLLADEGNTSYLPRRYSEETWAERPNRPPLGPRAVTVHPPLSDLKESWLDDDTATPKPTEPSMPPSPEPRIRSASFGDEGSPTPGRDVPHSINGHDPASPTTVPIAGGGTLLKSAIGAAHVANSVRVLVVEDNSILRSLLVKWLKTKGYEFREGVDGSDGVRVFESEGPFDVVLVDLSMPVLDGIGATAAIRELERKNADRHAARILALTGMSSLEDKRRAFEAGVDGYLVKPVGFKTLDEVFTKLGINGHHART